MGGLAAGSWVQEGPADSWTDGIQKRQSQQSLTHLLWLQLLLLLLPPTGGQAAPGSTTPGSQAPLQ